MWVLIAIMHIVIYYYSLYIVVTGYIHYSYKLAYIATEGVTILKKLSEMVMPVHIRY